MEDLWRLFCGESNCSKDSPNPCNPQLVSLFDPSSCTNHALIMFLDVLLLILLFINMVSKYSSNKVELPARYTRLSTLQILSAVINGGVGVVYIGLGVWTLVINLRDDHSAVVPVHWWVLYLFHGITWMLVGLTVSLRGMYFPKAALQLLVIFAFLFAVICCFVALFVAIGSHEITTKVGLDIVTFIGASVLVLCTYKGYKHEESEETSSGSTLYSPLYNKADGGSKTDSVAQVTLFQDAG